MSFLEIKNMGKSFGETPVLKGINLSVEKGEVVAVIGASGNGKTTLLRCLNYLELPDCGTVTLDGVTVFDGAVRQKDRDIQPNRLRFGLVFQDFNLFPHLNVSENVVLAPNLLAKKKKKCDYNTIKKANLEKAEKLLASVGLGDKLRSYPCELSGGQKQRVAIARALALEPDVLCFDEPTSALDPALTCEVAELIRRLKTEEKRTMIVVTHEMSFAEAVADRIVFMSDGVIEEEGAAATLFANPQSPKLRAFIASELDFEEGYYVADKTDFGGNDRRTV